MESLQSQKLAQAASLLDNAGLDAWLVFVRETAEGADPVLPLILDAGLTWQSALVVSRTGRIAIVGTYDAAPVRRSGDWGQVVGYDRSIRGPLLDALERLVPAGPAPPRIGVNWSLHDPKADGLSHGMWLLLQEILAGSRFEGSLVSAEALAMALRGRKTPAELAAIRRATAETERLLDFVGRTARLGMSERDVQQKVHAEMDARGLDFAWDRAANPIVNAGPACASTVYQLLR